MKPWIYLFSKFTPEALLFEGLMIGLICTLYAAYWILRKRKYGLFGPDAPQNTIRNVLNELIIDAEQLRAQLFGLLASRDFSAMTATHLRGAGGGGSYDPGMAAQLAALEAKVQEQSNTMDDVRVEKARLEDQLRDALASGSSGNADTDDLRRRIKKLEDQLAEYAAIEDDLANLKRLIQENAELKARLALLEGGSPLPPPTEAAPSDFAIPVTEAPPVTRPEPVAEEPTAPVKKQAAEPSSSSSSRSDKPSSEKSDAELIDEFERLLNDED